MSDDKENLPSPKFEPVINKQLIEQVPEQFLPHDFVKYQRQGEGERILDLEAATLEVKLENERRRLRVEGVRVLLDKRLRQVVRVLRQAVVQVLDDLEALFSFLEDATALATEGTRKRQRAQRNSRRWVLAELAVEQRDLHEKASDVLHFLLLDDRATAKDAQPRFRRRVTQRPLDCRKNVALHLDERRLVVSLLAHLSEVLNSWYALLGVLELRSDPERGASDKLVVLNVDDPLRDVAVDDVQREVERFRAKPEDEVKLHEEVHQAGTHMPSDLWLLVHRHHMAHGAAL